MEEISTVESAADPGRQTTQELVDLAARGDAEAAETLARRVYPTLLGAARADLARRFRAVRKWADSQDLAQSAYYDVIRALPSYRPREKVGFRAWILGVLRNKLRRRAAFANAERRDARREVPLLPERIPAGFGGDPQAALLALEDRTRLEAAVERLKPEHREVVRLRYEERLAWSEVAGRLGKTQEAAQMSLQRALAILRKSFDETRA